MRCKLKDIVLNFYHAYQDKDYDTDKIAFEFGHIIDAQKAQQIAAFLENEGYLIVSIDNSDPFRELKSYKITSTGIEFIESGKSFCEEEEKEKRIQALEIEAKKAAIKAAEAAKEQATISEKNKNWSIGILIVNIVILLLNIFLG